MQLRLPICHAHFNLPLNRHDLFPLLPPRDHPLLSSTKASLSSVGTNSPSEVKPSPVRQPRHWTGSLVRVHAYVLSACVILYAVVFLETNPNYGVTTKNRCFDET